MEEEEEEESEESDLGEQSGLLTQDDHTDKPDSTILVECASFVVNSNLDYRPFVVSF